MNDRDKISEGIPYEEPSEQSSASGAGTGSGSGRSWGTGSAKGFSEAAPPESDAPRDDEEKSALLAGLMAFLPGAGHLYLGAVNRGLFFLGSFIALIFAVNSYELRGLHPLFGLLMPFLLIYNVVDAVRGARAINRARAIGAPMPVFGVPWIGDSDGSGGRIPGWAFIVMGVFLLGVTRFDWDLDWLIDWWPVALIVIGVRMITKGQRGG